MRQSGLLVSVTAWACGLLLVHGGYCEIPRLTTVETKAIRVLVICWVSVEDCTFAHLGRCVHAHKTFLQNKGTGKIVREKHQNTWLQTYEKITAACWGSFGVYLNLLMGCRVTGLLRSQISQYLQSLQADNAQICPHFFWFEVHIHCRWHCLSKDFLLFRVLCLYYSVYSY